MFTSTDPFVLLIGYSLLLWSLITSFSLACVDNSVFGTWNYTNTAVFDKSWSAGLVVEQMNDAVADVFRWGDLYHKNILIALEIYSQVNLYYPLLVSQFADTRCFNEFEKNKFSTFSSTFFIQFDIEIYINFCIYNEQFPNGNDIRLKKKTPRANENLKSVDDFSRFKHVIKVRAARNVF